MEETNQGDYPGSRGSIELAFSNLNLDTVQVSCNGNEGIHLTPDHKILTEKGWMPCGDSEGSLWAEVRKPGGTLYGNEDADKITLYDTQSEEQVYDIRNCGPRHRFAVYDPGAGKLRIVSNCTQGMCRDILAEAMLRVEKAGFNIVAHVHDEMILEVPIGVSSVEEICELMAVNPTWCPDLPLKADGYECDFYMKA